MDRERNYWCFCNCWHIDIGYNWPYLCFEVSMMRITYGFGGYDKTKPNNNIVGEYDDGIDPEPETDPES